MAHHETHKTDLKVLPATKNWSLPATWYSVSNCCTVLPITPVFIKLNNRITLIKLFPSNSNPNNVRQVVSPMPHLFPRLIIAHNQHRLYINLCTHTHIHHTCQPCLPCMPCVPIVQQHITHTHSQPPHHSTLCTTSTPTDHALPLHFKWSITPRTLQTTCTTSYRVVHACVGVCSYTHTYIDTRRCCQLVITSIVAIPQSP